MNVLIADDEPLALALLERFLVDTPGIESVTSCVHGADAVAALQSKSVDLAFLDVRMPGYDAFAVLEQVPAPRRPCTIFVTAHHEFAAEAFDVDVADYLLKPFDRERFDRALQRACDRIAGRRISAHGDSLVELLQDLRASRATPRLAVQLGRSVRIVDPEELIWVEAQDKIVVFHMDSGALEARQSLADTVRSLDPQRFLQVHRSCIVAVDRVRALEFTAGGAPIVILDNGDRVAVSRARVGEVRERLTRR